METAVIAGLGPGFGEELAWKLADDYRLAFFARSADYLEERAVELREAGHEALAVPTDITDPVQVREGFDRVRGEFGPVDVLTVQASGESGWGAMGDLSAEEFERALDVYAYGTFLCANEAVADMREAGGGTVLIVGVTERYGKGRGHGYVAACAAKRALADSMARELGPEIHVAHVGVDGFILNPDVREAATPPIDEDRYIDPESAAAVCARLIEQDGGAWNSSIDLRAPVDDLDGLLDEFFG